MKLQTLSGLVMLVALPGCATHAAHTHLDHTHSAPGSTQTKVVNPGDRRWLAGDHHIHSEFSADYPQGNDSAVPPMPVLAADGRYSIPTNAAMAREHGLAWMVSTDHGGPLHSKLNYEQAYPALQRSRKQVPEVVQFYGMEFDTPAGDHSSLIVPHTHHEREALQEVESRYLPA